MGSGKSSQAKVHNILRAVFRQAVADGLIVRSPMDAVNRPKAAKEEAARDHGRAGCRRVRDELQPSAPDHGAAA